MSERREEITKLATRTAQRDGLRSVSFRQLADEIGIKSASVHYHFPTKPDLAQALVTEYTEDFIQHLADIERRSDSLIARLDALTEVFDAVVKKQNLCLCGMLAAELTTLNAETHKALQKFFSLLEKWVENAFKRYPQEIALDLTPEQLARIFVSGLEGAMLLDRIEDDGKRIDAFRQLARTLTQ